VCGDIIPTKNEWSERHKWLDKIPAFDSFAALEQASENQGISLALLRPERVLDLEVTKARNPDWTEDERNKLVRQQMQDDIFTRNNQMLCMGHWSSGDFLLIFPYSVLE
jgi:hypothetical protein